MPGRSALTVTPRTAATVPIALREAGQRSCRATVVVTASGGGWKEAAMAIPAWICLTLMVPTMPRKAATATSITIIRLVIELHSFHLVRPRLGACRPWVREDSASHGTGIDDSALNYDP